jgi:glutathione S-transferase
MYALYIANKNYSSWSLRPWILLRELSIRFEERLVPFEPKSSWDTFRTFSPTGKVPCLIDGDEIVWDSLAITEYLAERHPGVWPASARARTWARCAAAEMHSGFGALRERCPMNCGVRARLKEVPEPLQRDIDRIGELWNEGLHRFGGPYLAGERFSAVDAFFAPVAFRVQTYVVPLEGSAMAYASRLLALPSMQGWYTDALAEPWREDDHEEEVRKSAEWIEDRRKSSQQAG